MTSTKINEKYELLTNNLETVRKLVKLQIEMQKRHNKKYKLDEIIDIAINYTYNKIMNE